jgi:hypothetical protein
MTGLQQGTTLCQDSETYFVMGDVQHVQLPVYLVIFD